MAKAKEKIKKETKVNEGLTMVKVKVIINGGIIEKINGKSEHLKKGDTFETSLIRAKALGEQVKIMEE